MSSDSHDQHHVDRGNRRENNPSSLYSFNTQQHDIYHSETSQHSVANHYSNESFLDERNGRLQKPIPQNQRMEDVNAKRRQVSPVYLNTRSPSFIESLSKENEHLRKSPEHSKRVSSVNVLVKKPGNAGYVAKTLKDGGYVKFFQWMVFEFGQCRAAYISSNGLQLITNEKSFERLMDTARDRKVIIYLN